MKPILPRLNRIHTPAQAHASRYVITLVVTLATTLEMLDNTVVSVAIPSMMGNLGATLDEIAWVTTGYAIANAIIVPISSWLGDLFGRRNYFALSILVFIVSSVLCGTASTVQELVLWRIVQGLAGGGLIPMSTLTLFSIFPPTELGIGLAIWGAGLNLGPALGPMFAGWLTDTLSWPWIFYINLPIGAVTLLLALMYVPDGEPVEKPGRIDFTGLVLLAVAIGCLQAMIERGERQGWFESSEIMAYAVLCALAVPLFIWHERRVPHPIIDLGVFRNRQFLGTLPIGMMVGAVAYMTGISTPVFLQTQLGYTALQAALAQIPWVIALIISFAIVGKMTSNPRIDMRYVIFAGLIVLAWSLWLNGNLTLQAGNDDILLPLAGRGVGIAMSILPLASLAVLQLPPHQVGVGNSLYNLFRQVGGSLGVAAFTSLLEQRTHLNRGELVAQVHSLSPQAADRLDQWRQLFLAHGDPPLQAASRALQMVDGTVNQQAAISAFNQIYVLFALAVLVTLLAVPVMVSGRVAAGSSPSH